jgi:vacuolar-type H+-ATPase subunit E/Vma4
MAEAPAAVLLGQLRHDAEAAAARRIAEARTAATKLRTESAGRIAGLRAAACGARERAHAVTLESLRAETRERTAREWLSARAEALDRVFVTANESLVARAGEPRFLAAVATLAREAASYLPPGEAIARCAPSLVPAMRAVLESPASGRAAIRVIDDAAVATGVLLASADGAVAIDATLGRRLARERPRLAIEVARQLEPVAP